MQFSLSRTSKIKRVPFYLKSDVFCYAGGCPDFLNRDLDKVYKKELRSQNPTKRKKIHNTIAFYDLVCRNIETLI